MKRFVIASHARAVFARAVCVGWIAAGCGGPNYQYDPAPAPGWTQSTGGAKGGVLEGIGAVPATAQVQRDLELAVADAKAKIAQTITSQVTARTSDWAINVESAGEARERQMTSQHIEIRSAVTVEGAQVAASYRDEATRTQYVRVTVDQRAWAESVARRLETHLAGIAEHLDRAEAALDGDRPLSALGALYAAIRAGAEVEGDVVVADLLAPALGIGKRLAEQQRRRDALRERIGSVAAAVAVKGGGEAADELKRVLGEFLASYGLSVAPGGRVRIEASLGARSLGTERVGNRTEHVYGAVGTLEVREPDGSPVAALAVSLPDRAYTERDSDASAAERRALRLAADSLASRFRSAFRTAHAAE